MYILHNLHVLYVYIISTRKYTDRKNSYIAVIKNIILTSYASCKLYCVRKVNNYSMTSVKVKIRIRQP